MRVMADDRHLVPGATLLPDPQAPPSAGLTREEFEALAAELHELRRTYEGELADRLREARTSGSPGDNEDVLAVHAEVSVNAARIVRLQDLLRSAQIVEREFDGCVSLGCTVRVADDDGRTAEYTLIGRRGEESGRREVSPGSPVGKALLGARPGQLVRVAPPGRRARALRILDVSPSGLGAQMPARKGDAEAA
jgi:transcription elongation factor GreA